MQRHPGKKKGCYVATDSVRKSQNSFLVLAEKLHAVICQLEQVGIWANY